MNSCWRWIPGYEGRYKICTDGRVKSFVGWKPRELKPVATPGWYPGVSLCKDNKSRRVYIHRLLALTFIPNPLNLATVNHINGDKGDYRLENLEWMSVSENMKHAWQNGLMLNRSGPRGPKHRSAKLNEDLVREIRGRYQPRVKGKGHYVLAREYGVSQHTISDVVKRITWKHVD